MTRILTPSLTRRAFAGASVLLAPGWAQASTELQRETRPLMGTQVRVLVPGRRDDVAPALADCWAQMQRLEALLSRYRTDNPLAALARAAGRSPVAVPPEVLAVLRAARERSEQTGGAFDVTVGAYQDWHFEAGQAPALPTAQRLAEQRRVVDWRAIEIDGTQVLLNRPGMRLDLGGIAKLPILEAGLQALRRHGVRDALVDGGGDIGAMGRLDGRAWRVGLRDPLTPDRMLGVVAVEDGWVASSGDYERGFVQGGRRYHHILDPRTGWPTQGVRGLSLLAQDARALNGLGAALMVRGGAPSVAALGAGVEGVLVHADGRRWQSAGMGARWLA